MYKYNYIKQTREAKGITTVKMAQLLNMDCGNYCRLEQGKYKNKEEILLNSFLPLRLMNML